MLYAPTNQKVGGSLHKFVYEYNIPQYIVFVKLIYKSFTIYCVFYCSFAKKASATSSETKYSNVHCAPYAFLDRLYSAELKTSLLLFITYTLFTIAMFHILLWQSLAIIFDCHSLKVNFIQFRFYYIRDTPMPIGSRVKPVCFCI